MWKDQEDLNDRIDSIRAARRELVHVARYTRNMSIRRSSPDNTLLSLDCDTSNLVRYFATGVPLIDTSLQTEHRVALQIQRLHALVLAHATTEAFELSVKLMEALRADPWMFVARATRSRLWNLLTMVTDICSMDKDEPKSIGIATISKGLTNLLGNQLFPFLPMHESCTSSSM